MKREKLMDLNTIYIHSNSASNSFFPPWVSLGCIKSKGIGTIKSEYHQEGQVAFTQEASLDPIILAIPHRLEDGCSLEGMKGSENKSH